MSNPMTPQRGGRSKSGCLTCRARKIRCDERAGECFNCAKLSIECEGPPSDQSPSHTRQSASSDVTTGIKRKRTFRSCMGCRASKTRCSGDKPVCVRCREKSISCDYEDLSEPAWKQQLKYAGALQSTPTAGEMAGDECAPSQSGSSEQRPLIASDNHLEAASAPETHASNPLQNQQSRESACLYYSYLPGIEKVRALVEYYFANVHPLRCLGFLHKPSFMQRLDTGNPSNRDSDALLHVVCALGALFAAAESEDGIGSPGRTLAAGSQWAKKAQHFILSQLGNIVVENLMAAILLHDYELRMGDFGNAFMLSGITARMAQALQINLEHSTDVLCQNSDSSPGATTKESRRRLMWCCYITDSLIGNGIDQLTLIKETDIKIQLPCNERNFLLQTACVTEVLEQSKFLDFVQPDAIPSRPMDNMGIRAYYIRYIAIRRKVLKYIKHLDIAQMPWLSNSEFAEIDSKSRAWYNTLPASLQYTSAAMYIRKETSQLGALFSLHYMYHQTMCALYRIGAPALYKLRSAFSFPPERADFHNYLQSELFAHARSLAIITVEAVRHGPHALADPWIPTIVYDACRLLLYYLTQLVDPSAERSKALMSETMPLIESNVKALRYMQSMYTVAELLSDAADKMLEKVLLWPETATSGQKIIPDEPYPGTETERTEDSGRGTPVQSAPDYVLNPLSIYRMARKTIPEKHETLQNVQRQSAPESIATHGKTCAQSGPHAFVADTPGFEGLLPLFTSDPSGWTWQPSNTAIGSQNESNGLPPWDSYEQQLDAWMPMFSGEPQQYGFT